MPWSTGELEGSAVHACALADLFVIHEESTVARGARGSPEAVWDALPRLELAVQIIDHRACGRQVEVEGILFAHTVDELCIQKERASDKVLTD